MKQREKFLKRSKEMMGEALRSRDIFLGKASKSIDETNNVINLLGERLEEMFRLYTPELDVTDREKYAQLISIVSKNGIDGKKLSKLFGSAGANEIARKIKLDEMEDEDLEECKDLANEIMDLYALREKLEEREVKMCESVCPNLSYVGGPHLAAKLIAHVGSLRRLAFLPASTIQVIGAEKALFKHLKNRNIKPPKHGLIFQHPWISNSPRRVRGKIARTLAAKLVSAAKADAFTKNFIAEKLKKEFDVRYKNVMEEAKRNKKRKRETKDSEEVLSVGALRSNEGKEKNKPDGNYKRESGKKGGKSRDGGSDRKENKRNNGGNNRGRSHNRNHKGQKRRR